MTDAPGSDLQLTTDCSHRRANRHRYSTGSQHPYSTELPLSYSTGSKYTYSTGSQHLYSTGPSHPYINGSQHPYSTGSQHLYSTDSPLPYSRGSLRPYSTGPLVPYSTGSSQPYSRRSHQGSTTEQTSREAGNRHDTNQLSEPGIGKVQTDKATDALNNTFPFTKPRLSRRSLNSSLREGLDRESAVFDDRDGTGVHSFQQTESCTTRARSRFKQVTHDAASIAASCDTGLKLSTDCSHRNQAHYQYFPLNFGVDGFVSDNTGVHVNHVNDLNNRSMSDTESVTSDLQLSLDCSHRKHNSVPRLRHEILTSSTENGSMCRFNPRNNVSREQQGHHEHDVDNVFVLSDNQLYNDMRQRKLDQRQLLSSSDSQTEQCFDTRNSPSSDLQISTDCSHRNHNSRSTDSEHRRISTESVVNRDQVPITEKEFARSQRLSMENYDSMHDFAGTDLRTTQNHSYWPQQFCFNASDSVNKYQSLGSHMDSGLSLTLDCSHRRNSSVCMSEESFEASSVYSDLRITDDTSHRRRSMPMNIESRKDLSHINTRDHIDGCQSEAMQSSYLSTLDEPCGISNQEMPHGSSKACASENVECANLKNSNKSKIDKTKVVRSRDSNLGETNDITHNDSNNELPNQSRNTEMNLNQGRSIQRINQIHNTRHSASNSEEVKKENAGVNKANKDASVEAKSNSSLDSDLNFCERIERTKTCNRSKLLLHRESSTDKDKLIATGTEANQESSEITRKSRKRFRSGSDSNLLLSSKRFVKTRQPSVDRLNKRRDSTRKLSSTHHDKVLRISNRDTSMSKVRSLITGECNENSKEQVSDVKTNNLKNNDKFAKDVKSVENISATKSVKHDKAAKHVQNANNRLKVRKIDHPVPRVSFKITSGKSHTRRSWPSVDKKQQLIQKLHKTIAEVDHNTGGSIPGLSESEVSELNLSHLESMMPLNTENSERKRNVKHSKFMRRNGLLYRRHDNGGIWETVVSKFVS